MKRNKALLFLSIFLALFLESFSTVEWRDLRLVGQWKISEVTHNDEKIDIDKIPYCENKENIEFKDSTFKWEQYTYYKNRCFKDITTGKYNIDGGYDYFGDEKKWVTMLRIPRSDFIIVKIDNANLKLKDKYVNTIRSYKKIK